MIKCGLDETQKDGLGRTPLDCAEDHPDVEGLFKALPPPSFRVARQVAREMAQEMEEIAAQVEDPGLPTGTLIKNAHEELRSDVRCILEKIGNGTFGDVYKAQHPRAQRDEAVKVVRLVDRRGKPLDDAERIKRLQSQVDEAEIMLELGLHPNIVAIRGILLLRTMRDASDEAVADNLYVFMDYVEDGMTLARCIEKVDMHIETKIRVGREIGRASCRERV